MRKDLEERLIHFAASVLSLCREMEKNDIAKHFTNQLIRSSSSSAMNYGEAQGAESKRDFIHKVSIVLKELRESHVNIRIMKEGKLFSQEQLITHLQKESNELISIFCKTLQTARKKQAQKTEGHTP